MWKKHWKLRNERAAIEERQQSLRQHCDELLGDLKKAEAAYRKAEIEGDEQKAEKLTKVIESLKGELTEFNKIRIGDVEALDKSAHVQLQDNGKWNNAANTGLTALGIVGGAGLTYLGMKAAYDADNAGSLINKGVLGAIRGLNPFSLLRKH